MTQTGRKADIEQLVRDLRQIANELQDWVRRMDEAVFKDRREWNP